ncbi:MAG TPA: efflux RND transporter periplasmic adaptor subunit [Verrucomicrobiae bacterium]|nr:efflux RND transporter periplasmic adaptor subunit [Verrucomicrobiae bacterium]
MAHGNVNNTPGGLRRPWIVPVAIFLLLFFAVGAFVYLRPRRIRVSVVQPMRQTISNSITTNGKVEPVHGFEAHAPLAGTIQKLLVKEGDRVQAGQLLLVMDDSRGRADLAVAQTRLKGAQERYANLIAGGTEQQLLSRRSELQKATTEREAAQRQLDALTRLQQKGAATQVEVAAAADRLARAKADLTELQSEVRYSAPEKDRVQGEINDAKVAIQLAQDMIDKCNVRAASAGIVYFLPVRAGGFVNTGELLLQEADLSQLQVRAFVDEPEIGRLSIGQTVRITWDAMPGRVWEGTVASLPSTVVSRGSRVVGEVLCKFDNPDHRLLPNVNVNTTIISSNSEEALTVPREAIHENNGRNYVFVLRDGHLHLQDIQLGISNLTRVEVRGGISEKDMIAVQSYSPSPMTDGIKVKIVENPT